jgi:hypothetical protein
VRFCNDGFSGVWPTSIRPGYVFRIKSNGLTVLLQISVEDITLDPGALEGEVVVYSRDPLAGISALDASQAVKYWVYWGFGGLAKSCSKRLETAF